jgi:hypothetical protein
MYVCIIIPNENERIRSRFDQQLILIYTTRVYIDHKS